MRIILVTLAILAVAAQTGLPPEIRAIARDPAGLAVPAPNVVPGRAVQATTGITLTIRAYLPLAFAGYPAKLLANGDFEQGRDGSWRESSALGRQLVYGDLPHGGSWGAWLGGGDDEFSVISQTIVIPTNATTLNYWYWIDSADSCGWDVAHVQVNSTVVQSYQLCSSTDTGGWVREQVDVSAFRGRVVDLGFVVTTDFWMWPSNFWLDDVSISAHIVPAS